MEINQLMIIPDCRQIEASLAVANKYHCGFEYQDFFLPDLLEKEEECEKLLQLYENCGVCNKSTFHGVFFDIVVFSDDPRIRSVSNARVEQSLSQAARLGAKGCVFHTNYTPNFLLQSYRKNWVSRNAAFWREKLKAYPQMEIYLENMFDVDWILLEQLAKEMSDEPRFGVCLDYAHAHAFGKSEEIEQWVTALAPYVKHIHINDNDLASDLHLTIGEGMIDWEGFARLYQKYLSNASVLIELRGFDKIEKSLEMIRRL